MIPYAALMISLEWPDGRALKASARDVSLESLNFRVAEADRGLLENAPERIRLWFYDLPERAYRECTAFHFTLTLVSQPEEPLPGAAEYRAEIRDENFAAEMGAFLKSFASYVRIRQECSETEAAERLTGREIPETYAESLADWRKKELAENLPVKGEEALKPAEIAVCLDCPSEWEGFLSEDTAVFTDRYLRENLPADHPLMKAAVTHIYIGNQFCPLLFPEKDTLERILKKAAESSCIPVICFAPMGEQHIPLFRERIIFLNRWLEETQQTAVAALNAAALELIVNDAGTALMLREMAEKGEICSENFSLRAGILLNKRKKDPRTGLRIRGNEDEAANLLSSIDADLYRKYLADRLNITCFSYETGSCPENTGGNAALHLPLYQTNTAGYCTLYAAVKKGKRGMQEPVTACPHYCEEYGFFYPEKLHMTGRFNTLFGCRTDELNDTCKLNRLIAGGISRLVIRI